MRATGALNQHCVKHREVKQHVLKQRALKRRVAIIALTTLAMLSACRNSATWNVAMGARGSVSTMYGPCTPPTSGPVRFPSAGRYEAVSPGTARLRCRDGDVVLEVREPARIAINPVPEVTGGRQLFYGAKVYDAAGGELDLGDDTVLRWSFGGALSARPNPGCGHMMAMCPSANTGFATAGEPGVGTIVVSLGTLSARSTTRVTPR